MLKILIVYDAGDNFFAMHSPKTISEPLHGRFSFTASLDIAMHDWPQVKKPPSDQPSRAWSQPPFPDSSLSLPTYTLSSTKIKLLIALQNVQPSLNECSCISNAPAWKYTQPLEPGSPLPHLAFYLSTLRRCNHPTPLCTRSLGHMFPSELLL